MPVKEAGCLMDPPVSVPIVAGVSPAAKAEAEPPEVLPLLWQLDLHQQLLELILVGPSDNQLLSLARLD